MCCINYRRRLNKFFSFGRLRVRNASSKTKEANVCRLCFVYVRRYSVHFFRQRQSIEEEECEAKNGKKQNDQENHEQNER